MTINQLKEKLNNKNIKDDLLICILFEMNRYFDKSFVSEIKKVQKENEVVFDSIERKNLRKRYYYGDFITEPSKYSISHISYSDEDLKTVLSDVEHRLDTYDESKILMSIEERAKTLNTSSNENDKKWLKEYQNLNKESKYSLLELRVNQKIFAENGCNSQFIFDFIAKTYMTLENYRRFVFVVDGELYDDKNNCVTWNVMSEVSIYAENFIKFTDKLLQFNRNKKIEELNKFLESRSIKDSLALCQEFYSGISTGFKYEDCYVNDNQQIKMLVFKKIALDTRHILCPDCHTVIQSSNSYPEMFLQSWECKNPTCSSRSKSGRGKRFDAYGVYRTLKLAENAKENEIDKDFYTNWRRDIFNKDLDWHEMILREYTFVNEKFYSFNDTFKKTYGRKEAKINDADFTYPKDFYSTYSHLPIVKLLENIFVQMKETHKVGNKVLSNQLEIQNENSTIGIANLKPNQIGGVITSPPYYNAREYSQWPNLVCYLIDMMANAYSVLTSCEDGSYYLYNIGDIVSEDNVYVSSHTSKRRIPLGFFSYLIFDIVGFNLVGNILWDKGEVQSKRNSTNNLYSGFIKCVNCYEHFLVFRKGQFEFLSNTVERIVPVIKINSKGENKAKHTAPYPVDLVNLGMPYINKEKYVLDPFLGSGTTLVWCRENGLKGIGFEMNEDYYNLCLENVGIKK